MAEAKQPDAQANKQRRNRTVLLLCMLLLLGGIGAEAYLLIRRADHSILTVQRNPETELLEAVRAGDYDSARLICLTDYPDGIVPEQVSEQLTARAQDVRDAYFAGQTDAESAKALTQGLLSLDIPSLTEAVQPLYEEIRIREMRMTIIQKANASYEAGEYLAAFQLYRKLPQEDESLYPYYKEQLGQTAAYLTAQTMDDMEAAEREHDYDTAVSLAENMLRLYDGKAEFWDALLSVTKAHRMQYQYLQACKTARTCFDAGSYAEALNTLSEISETIRDAADGSGDLPDAQQYRSLLDDTLQSYQDAYFRILAEKLHILLESGDLTQAEQLAAEAEALYPDAEETAAVKAQVQEAQPKELISFGEPELSDFTRTDAELTGFNSKTYQSDTGNLYCSYDGALTGRQRCSAVFHIGGGYRKLTLTALPLDSFGKDTIALLEVSGDGKELETYAISRKNGVLNIVLDITGTEQLRLRVLPAAGADDLRNAGVIIADAKVTA